MVKGGFVRFEVNDLIAYKPLLFSIIVFLCSLGLWFRSSLFGLDSYAFKANVCTGFSSTVGNNPLALHFFGLMPCNLLFFKLVMFLSLLVSLYFVFLVVKKEFNERTAWQSIFLLMALGPLLLFEFGKFENELFAYPFIVFGIYCFLNRDWFGGVSGLVASLVFWGWPFYLTFFGGGVLEQQLFAGLLPLFGLVFVVPLIFLSKDRKVLLGGAVSVVLFLWNAKLFIFLIPFVCLGLAELVKLLDEKQRIKDFVMPLAFILLLGWNVAFFLASPTINELKIVEETVQLHKDTNFRIYNDWSYGYWLLDAGYDSQNYGGGEDENYFGYKKPFIGLSMKDLSVVGCEPTSQGFSSLTRSMKVWKCN